MTLSLEGVGVWFPTGQALTDVDLVAAAGRPHFVIGGSGSGKSTLCAAVTGLLPGSAKLTGQVSVDGHPEPRRGSVIGVVPQSAMTCFTPVRRLGGQLAETVRHLRGERGPEELLELVGLEAGALRKYPHELSGGMVQRAAIAAALAGDPPVVVADEPTSALDRDHSRDIVALLTGLGSDRVVLVTTHDFGVVPDDADLTVMLASRVVETGRAADVLTTPEHPYTRDLLAALPENGLNPLPADRHYGG